MSDDDKIILTVEEAISLLPHGRFVHNFANPGGMLVGCDYETPEAHRAIKAAKLLEIGGPTCKSMNHALVVHDEKGHYSFFSTDNERVDAMEKAKSAAAQSSTQPE